MQKEKATSGGNLEDNPVKNSCYSLPTTRPRAERARSFTKRWF